MAEITTLVGKTLLSRYKVIKQIGRGGFAYTYLAIDTALPNQPFCVVKRLSPQSSNEQKESIAKKLFEREAKSLYHLGEHDRIPRLYAHFCQEGQFYLVQEFIQGRELSEEIQPGNQLSESETIELLREILEVLKVIHDGNLIHRDLKPSNIMRREKDGKLVIIDFGIVKEFNIDTTLRTPNTTRIGSSGYMAHEQALGYPQLASDIYAVGIIGILALSGLKAKDVTVESKSRESLWRSKIEVSNKLGDFLEKMVRFDFQQRYHDASEALHDLNLLFPSSSAIDDENNNLNSGKRLKFKITIGAISGLIAIGIAGFFLTNKYYHTADLDRLEKYLSQEKWDKADRTTDRIIIQSIGNQLGIDEINDNLSCEELTEMNQLWQSYSDNRFGFKIQKQIYLDSGNQLDEYSEKNYQEFRDLIGNDNISEGEKPLGYYPTLNTIYQKKQSLHSLAHWMLLYRSKTCGL